jgi:hypothetical protein
MVKINLTRKKLVAIAALALGVLGSAAVPASANAASTRTQVAPSSSSDLYFCDYDIGANNIALWNFPGGSGRSGNTVNVRIGAAGLAFNSIPWISSGTVNGQRWIYGVALVPNASIGGAGGGSEYIYGWVGRNYLNIAECGTDWFVNSNGQITNTSYGDPFSSEPSEVSASYQGQTWVYGVDPYASNAAGWVGSSWLTLSSCNSSGCFYTIKASNTHEWYLPGGAAGP